MNNITRNFQNANNVEEIFADTKIREVYFNGNGGITIFFKVNGSTSDSMGVVDADKVDEWLEKHGDFITEKAKKDLGIA